MTDFVFSSGSWAMLGPAVGVALLALMAFAPLLLELPEPAADEVPVPPRAAAVTA